MSAVTLNSNIAAQQVQHRLGESTARLGESLDRLSSGLRINKASDDAAGLAIATALEVDARVFNQGVRNVNDGISYLNVAEGATDSLKTTLIRMRELSTQSSNGTLSDTQRQALDKEFQGLVNEHNRVVATTHFQGTAIFSAQNATLTVQAGYGANGTLRADLAGTTTTSVITGDGTFQAKQSFATGFFPISVAVSDFNGDGKQDLVTADVGDNTANVLLGNGDGTFQPRQAFSTGNFPYSVSTADFNGDGKQDLVTTDFVGNTASVLLGNGDGTFQAKQSFATGTNPRSVAAADFNGDGKQDLVTADYGDNTASVLLGNGDGTFQAKQSFATGGGPYSIAINDFNGDGKQDLVTADYGDNTASVLLGNGNGTFQAKQSFATGTNPISVAVSDFNGDGKQDLVTADVGGNAASVLLGNGNGTFQAKQSFATGGGPYSIAINDFNGDGKQDLVTADYGDNTASVLLGNGNGTFQAKQSFATGTNPISVAVSDFNGDGKQDLVTADVGGNAASVLLGNGTLSSMTVTFGLSPIGGSSVATRAAALAAQGQVDGYLQTVNTVAGIIGASLSRFEVATQVLETSSENFRAAESRIRDADLADEAAQFVKNRILQQAGIAVLTQANQLPGLGLRLLRP